MFVIAHEDLVLCSIYHKVCTNYNEYKITNNKSSFLQKPKKKKKKKTRNLEKRRYGDLSWHGVCRPDPVWWCNLSQSFDLSFS
jgi:hypothetical protein